MPLLALWLTIAILFLSASLRSDPSPYSLFSMLPPDLLIAHRPKFSHISFMFNQLHWLPLSARIGFKIVVLVLKSKLGVAPKFLRDHIVSPLSATSHRPRTPLFRLVGSFCSTSWTTVAQTRSFTTIVPSFYKTLPSSLRLTLLSANCLDIFQHPSPISKPISTLGVFAQRALLRGLYSLPWAALYKFRNTIR